MFKLNYSKDALVVRRTSWLAKATMHLPMCIPIQVESARIEANTTDYVEIKRRTAQ